MCGYRHCLAAGLAMLLGSAPFAQAQGIAGSFEQLRLLVRPGDTITVRDSGGSETRGRVGSLSSSTLVLLSGQGKRELREPEVSTILARRSDPLSNGALWGLGVGAAVGGVAIGTLCAGDPDCAAPVVVGALIYGGLGAGIGVGVDALITRQQVIYERSAGSARLGLAPLLAPGRRSAGATLSVRF